MSNRNIGGPEADYVPEADYLEREPQPSDPQG